MASTPNSADVDAIAAGNTTEASIEPPITVSSSRLQRIRQSALATSIDRRFLLILLVVFVAKGVIFTFVFPPFSGHDEVAHYSYLEFVATKGRPPIIPDVEEWREAYAATGNQKLHDHMPEKLWLYCIYATADWQYCDIPEYRNTPIYAVTLEGKLLPHGWVYTANHPLLYYLTMTPIYWLSSSGSPETQLYLLRLAAIPFGLITVLFTWLMARELFPGQRFIAITTASFIAFQPQMSYEAAMLNNDIFAIAFTSIVFYLLAVGLRRGFPWRTCALIGLFFGLAMLSKNTSAVSGAVIAVAMVLGLGIRNFRAWLPKGIVTAAIGLLLVWPWYLYMLLTYGDFTGLNRVKELQYWNYGGGKPPTVWAQLIDPNFAWMRWRESWGEFGWRLIPLEDSLLWIIFWFCAIGLIGLAWWAMQTMLAGKGRTISLRDEEGHWSLPTIHRVEHEDSAAAVDPIYQLDRPARVAVITFVLACVIAYYAILQFGTTFSLTQARYYFPSIPAAALLIMLGYRALLPRRWLDLGQALFLLAFMMLNVVIFTQYVIPYWQPNL